MFCLTGPEKKEVVTNCDHLAVLKFSPQLPYVFTEQGVAMLSTPPPDTDPGPKTVPGFKP